MSVSVWDDIVAGGKIAPMETLTEMLQSRRAGVSLNAKEKKRRMAGRNEVFKFPIRQFPDAGK